MECAFCGADDPFPFKCPYCSEMFCGEHRLPENHACKMYAIARPPSRKSSVQPQRNAYSYGSQRTAAKFSSREAISLAIGSSLVFLVGMSILLGFGFPASLYYYALGINGILFVIAFVGHEYAHKYVANLKGLWAEFRLNLVGVILTVLSIFAPFFRIIAPGVTAISGFGDSRTMGTIGLWGPLTNIVATFVLLPTILVLPTGYILIPSYYLNSFIAVFNLIPFGGLDGQRVFAWDRKIWGLSFAASAASLVVSLYFLGFI